MDAGDSVQRFLGRKRAYVEKRRFVGLVSYTGYERFARLELTDGNFNL